MPNRELAPPGTVPNLRGTIEAFAKEHNLLVFEKSAFKIDWMTEHQGKCFCDWQNRTCPCDHLFEDLKKFNGNCLCQVFVTEERAKVLKRPRKVKVRTPEEQKAYKLLMKEKQKQSLELYSRLYKKKGKRGQSKSA